MEMLITVFRLALRGLMAYKTRSLLTMLGIIIGIGAVIIMISVGRGANNSIQSQIKNLGSNMLMVFPGSSQRGGVRGGRGSRATLKIKDAEAIARECPSVLEVTHITARSAQIVAGENNWNTIVSGTTATYPLVRDWAIQEGQFLNDHHIRSAANVVVVGRSIVENLFGSNQAAVGRKLRIYNVPFRIIGVLSRKGSDPRGKDQDDTVFIPHTTFTRKLQGSQLPGVVHIICISAKSKTQVIEAKIEVSALLRQMHRIRAGAEDDFSVQTLDEFAQMANKTMGIMTILLTSIASVSLIVGGIGIMNIMLVSVTERTREIGIRLAVGARKKDVLIQFLVEAITLSLIGGIFGTVLGICASLLIGYFTGWMIPIQLDVILLASLFSAAVGIFFGFYPAQKASAMNPIEALRYE
ncbi:MAG: FtsX-like permease family protein [Bacteroidetes bacterium]|nr:FtsX-like permease family protein [Bacteroidota bacterium]